MGVKENLIKEFESELDEVSKMEVGVEQHKMGVDAVTKLADRIIEIEKIESEKSIKEEQAKIDKRDQLTKNLLKGLEIGVSAISLGVAVWVHISGMKYDKEGIIPTTPGGKSAEKQLLRFKF